MATGVKKINVESKPEQYGLLKLDDDHLKMHPWDVFCQWFNQAISECEYEPNAMILSTVSKSRVPSSRVVLIKSVEEESLVFFTNYSSPKCIDLDSNNNCSGLFYWPQLERQVRLTGIVTKIPENKSSLYFNSRPEDSKIAALTSHQSEPIKNRNDLETRFNTMKTKFKDKKIPAPNNWGGLSINVNHIELWQGRKNRLHDRIAYKKHSNNTWHARRLQP